MEEIAEEGGRDGGAANRRQRKIKKNGLEEAKGKK